MWKCHKCGKPVYFAERKQSLGYNWHPECLRCEECGKRLNPGQHAEHKGVPYCHVPCYGALFGPQLFGHGTRVESHKSFGQQKDVVAPNVPRSHLEAKLKVYNQYFDGKSGEVRSREVNGRLILEGSLRIYWGVQGVIHLKENDDQRTVVTVRKRNSCRVSRSIDPDSDEEEVSNSSTLSDSSKSDSGLESSPIVALPKSVTLPSKLDLKNLEWDELDDLLQVERRVDDSEKLYQTMPVPLPSQCDRNSTETICNTDSSIEPASSEIEPSTEDLSLSSTQDEEWFANSNHLNRSMSGPDCLGRERSDRSPEFDSVSIETTLSDAVEDVVIRRPSKGSTAIRRRPGKRLSRSKVKRRCSINGHFYDRETSFFTPPHGSQTSVWVSSLVNTQEVINAMLEKYKVDSDGNNFALFVIRDNGEQRKMKDEEYPLLTRVLLGPHEDVAKLFLMDSHSTPEVSSEVAQFLNLSLAECRAILNQYYTQEEKEVAKLRDKYNHMREVILYRLEKLKVGLGV